MAYTATKYFSIKPFAYPKGQDFAGRTLTLRGVLADCDTATEYTPGGIGSSSFEVTAFSAVGLVTYTALKGAPLFNGQRVVIFNTASNTNDGTFIVSQLTATTFVAVPLPGNALSGTGQTAQTAEGVGQIQFGQKSLVKQTFTVTAVVVTGGVMKCTYTTLTGPQLQPGDQVNLAAMTHAGNDGPFSLVSVTPTSATGGSFTVNNPAGVSTDSGTGVGFFNGGSDAWESANVPISVKVFSTTGYVYVWDSTNYTFRVFLTGTAAGDPANEAALGATVAFDPTAVFEAVFSRQPS
jgi:hypothetical protein